MEIVKNGCGQSVHRTLKLTVSREWIDGINWFFACWYKFMQMKRCLKIFGVGIVRKGCGPVLWQGSKIVSVSEEWTDRIIDFLHVSTDSQKLKADQFFFLVWMVKNACGQSGHGTQKLTYLKKWADGIIWFFARWYIFRKAKVWFSDFWVVMVKNVHEILTSAVSW